MVWRRTQPVVSGDASEMSRQHTKKTDHWNCPLLTQDPGFGQMPPGMVWIRTDLPEGCERYRFYNEKGEVVTMCFGDEDTDTDTSDDSVIQVFSMARDENAPDTVGNTVTETDFATQYTIPAETVSVDDVFHVHICGVAKTDAVTNAGLRIRVYVAEFPVVDTTNLIIEAPATNLPWGVEFDIVVAKITEFGEVHYGGMWHFTYGPALTRTYLIRPFNSGGGSGIAFASDSDNEIRVSADWDTADTDNVAELIIFNVTKGRVGGGL